MLFHFMSIVEQMWLIFSYFIFLLTGSTDVAKYEYLFFFFDRWKYKRRLASQPRYGEEKTAKQ
jgi:hypothetical protein